MKKSFLLAGANLRKAKGQTATIVFLILLAAMMLNIWLMLAMDYKSNFDRCHSRLNAEHVTLCVDSRDEAVRSFLAESLEQDARTVEFRMDDIMNIVGSFSYHGGEVNTNFILLEKERALARSVGKVEILEEDISASGVYLPLLYKTGDISIGSDIEIAIGSNTMRYTVCGFFNSVMAGSHNCFMCALLLTEDKYRELEATGYAPESTLVSIRITDSRESEDYEAMLNNALSAQYPGLRTLTNNYALVSSSRYISQMICSGIVSAMAFFVLIIALVVISSNIANYIQENMENLGALKALGYTGKQLACSLLLQFLGVSVMAALAGAGLSYCAFPALNRMMIAQTGIPYALHFLPLPFLSALAIPCGAVALAVWLSSRRIRRIEPIMALRQGLRTHNFRRSHIPLEGTRAPLHLALSLKSALSGVGQNVTVAITMAVLSLVVVFSGLMTENMISDITPFLNMIAGETADSCINIRPDIENRFLEEMEADSRVEKVYLYHPQEVRHVDGVGLVATLCDDFSKVNNQEVCIEGRYPKYDNEIVIASKYARENGLRIGDEISLTADGKEATYLISGFSQISNHLGKDCLLTREGYQKLGEPQDLSFYLNLSEDTDIDAFNEEMNARFPGGINVVLNISSVIEGTSSVYVSLMTAIVAVVLFLSVAIVAFVLYLLVRTLLNHKKRDYGILKALGYTTGQLILQTALSFLPAMILSTAIGLTVCCLIINPLTAMFLYGIGIVKCTFTVPTGPIAAAGAVLVMLAFAIACLLSLRIRKIVPCALLSGE